MDDDDEIELRFKEFINLILNITEISADRSLSIEVETNNGKYNIEIKVTKID